MGVILQWIGFGFIIWATCAVICWIVSTAVDYKDRVKLAIEKTQARLDGKVTVTYARR